VTVLPDLRRFAISLSKNPDKADDLVQATMEKACIHWNESPGKEELRRWLFTVLKNRHIDDCRRVGRQRAVPLEESQIALPQAAAQDAHLSLKETLSKVRGLRPEERRVMTMSALDGMPHTEIAKRLGIRVGTVKSRLSRARRRLDR